MLNTIVLLFLKGFTGIKIISIKRSGVMLLFISINKLVLIILKTEKICVTDTASKMPLLLTKLYFDEFYFKKYSKNPVKIYKH